MLYSSNSRYGAALNLNAWALAMHNPLSLMQLNFSNNSKTNSKRLRQQKDLDNNSSIDRNVLERQIKSCYLLFDTYHILQQSLNHPQLNNWL
jgi:hypothetical protein